MTKPHVPPVAGEVAPGFEPVREEFERNFAERNELGAACAIYYRGQKVVDLWGGWRDSRRTQPWQSDTMVIVFSTTKGLAAMTLALAHSRGWLDYEARVADYWPEFAQAGKERVTVRQLLSHQAGLPYIDERLDRRKLADPDAVAAACARQRPAWEPGRRQGYHAISLGFYESELLRRVDPQHRSLGRFFAEEIAGPLGIECYIGLPADVPAERLAPIQWWTPRRLLSGANFSSVAAMLPAVLQPASPTRRAFTNPMPMLAFDRRLVYARGVEMPSVNGVASARAIARAYSAFALGGAELGLRAETLAALMAPARPPAEGFYDVVLCFRWALTLGFAQSCPDYRFGSGYTTFGAPGMGGSIGFADPQAQVGFAYVMNRMGAVVESEERQTALERAFYRCLGLT
jgi:CubicO group peptidase (beta-lactamase class C family)